METAKSVDLAVLCWQWAIFPVRRQTSIFASAELNFCVRNGNRWTLCDNITDFLLTSKRNKVENETETQTIWTLIELCSKGGSSPRSISISQLNTLLCLHLWPIKLVVYKCPYSFWMMGYLILKHVSRLDAFSVYHSRTRLLSYALGRTTDAPEVRPTRSSRTKVSSSQISYAHDR